MTQTSSPTRLGHFPLNYVQKEPLTIPEISTQNLIKIKSVLPEILKVHANTSQTLKINVENVLRRVENVKSKSTKSRAPPAPPGNRSTRRPAPSRPVEVKSGSISSSTSPTSSPIISSPGPNPPVPESDTLNLNKFSSIRNVTSVLADGDRNRPGLSAIEDISEEDSYRSGVEFFWAKKNLKKIKKKFFRPKMN